MTKSVVICGVGKNGELCVIYVCGNYEFAYAGCYCRNLIVLYNYIFNKTLLVSKQVMSKLPQ